MAEHPNVGLVRRVYEAFSNGDTATLAALFADDLAYHVPGENPLSGDYRGRDAVFALYGRVAELSDGTFKVDLHDVLADDDHAVALTSYSASRGGKRLTGAIECHVYHVTDGKITEIWQCLHDQKGFDRFWS